MVQMQRKSGKIKGGKKKLKSHLAKKKKLSHGDTSKRETEVEMKGDGTRKRLRSSSSISSTSSLKQTKKKKRVSFANELERSKVIQSIHKIKSVPSSASPGKSILATKEEKKMKKLKKKSRENQAELKVEKESIERIEKEEQMETDVVDDKVEKAVKKKHDNQTKATKVNSGRMEKKSAKKIQVTRKVKDKLMNMSRKERREFIKELQRKRKPNFDLALQCKAIWEKIRSGKCSEEDRVEGVHELYGLVKGKAKQLIYAHDTCRVIECLCSLPKGNIRNQLFQELTPEIVRMAKSKYARFFVTKMLRSGSSAQRSTVLSAFQGHCVSLMRISWSAEVLEMAYNDYANAQQRSSIVEEFYGNQYTMFKGSDQGVVTLKEIIKRDPTKQKAIMKSIEELLKDIVDKSQLKLSLTHRLLHEYLTFCNAEQKAEIIDSLKDRIPQIVHTNDGARVALKCIWDGTAKERKMIVKNFKGLVVKTCLEEFGHRVLIGLFDAVDDTVLVKKYIVQEIANEVREVAMNKFGERVLHYLVHPRDPRYFGKGSLDIFKEGDNNIHSKKEAKERYAQLFDGLNEAMVTFVAANLDELLFNPLTALLVLNLLEPSGAEDVFERVIDETGRDKCYAAIASMCSGEFVPCDTERLHAIEHPQAHFVISKLLQADAKFTVKLGDHLIKLAPETIASWTSCNRGCFILLHMYENGSDEVKETMNSCISIPALRNYSSKGAIALRNKLTGMA